ncbi:hypothetical protein PRIPAC_79789, partial [Pristionchus pacificus]
FKMVSHIRTDHPASSDEETAFEIEGALMSPEDESETSSHASEVTNGEANDCSIMTFLEKVVRDKVILELRDKQDEISAKDAEIERLMNSNEELQRKNQALSGKFSEVDLNEATTRTVTLKRERGGLFGMSTAGTSIMNVRVGSSADAQEIVRGDQIISIDGRNVETLSHKKIVRMIHDAADRCTFVLRHNVERLNDVEMDWIVEKSGNNEKENKRPRPPAKTSPQPPTPSKSSSHGSTNDLSSAPPILPVPQSDRTVTIRIGADGKFGMGRIGTSISGVRRGSSAELQGVRRGDQIVSINDIVVETVYIDIVAEEFKKARATGKIRLVVRYNPEQLLNLLETSLK